MIAEISYTASAYARASKDDVGSDTIDNQIEMIHNYIKGIPDIRIVSVRKDSGYSGIDFVRPSFIEMMKDIEAGKINCVIVKDLSRLGRNYLEVGELMDKIFPYYNVRLIAINDNYDSIKPRNDSDEIILPFKNILNEQYLRDFSKKIRSSLDSKRMNGEFVNAFAPYGYKRDENNKHKLVIDRHASAVVRDIFRLKIEGYSKQKIALILNEAGEPSPGDYKKRTTNFKCNFQRNERAAWTAASVGRILTNPVYTGILIQGQYTTPNYKVKKRIEKPKKDWHVIPDSHEPIISMLEFELVNDLLMQDNRIANNNGSLYPLSGYIYCADCGDSMVRQRSGKWIYFVCASSRKKGGCSSHCIQVQKLEATVLDVIKHQIVLTIEAAEALKIAKTLSNRQKEASANLNAQISDREKEIAVCKRFRNSLYEDYKSGIITKEDFVKFSQYYKSRIAELKLAVDYLRNEVGLFLNNDPLAMQWLTCITEYKNISELNRHVVVKLIERIEVFTGKRILIKLRYHDKLATMHDILNGLADKVL